MSSKRPLVIAAAVVGVLFAIIAVVYFAEPAKSLPSFFPGHNAHSKHHHTKHGLVAVVLAAGAFTLAWFATGPRARAA